MIYGFKTLHRVSKYMFIANNRNTRVKCEICSKLIIQIPERRQLRHSIAPSFSFSIADVEQVNVCCEAAADRLY